MSSLAVIGAQFGDEGKGKIVDFLAQKADVIVRFNGGSNAGHTVMVGEKTYKFHLIPSGSLYPEKTLLIGNGCVVDPEVAWEEILMVEREKGKINLTISERAHVVFSYHKVLDELQEKLKGKLKAGTTKRGIGPAYSDKSARFGLRMVDLINEDSFRRKCKKLFLMYDRLMQTFYNHKWEKHASIDEEVEKYVQLGRKLKPYVGDVSGKILNSIEKGENVLFEGAQGTLLDIDFGVYPFGTSSNTTVGGICVGAGVPPRAIDKVMGVTKAYLTRVGAGPVPTEIKGELARYIREKGAEYGATTGRPRRCGWLDAVALKYACRINGFDYLAVTKIDVLGGIEKVKICVAYEVNGSETKFFPADTEKLSDCKPVYEELDGWRNLSLGKWRKIIKEGYGSLPAEVKKFLERIEELCGVPVALVSVGPRRDETLVLEGTL